MDFWYYKMDVNLKNSIYDITNSFLISRFHPEFWYQKLELSEIKIIMFCDITNSIIMS